MLLKTLQMYRSPPPPILITIKPPRKPLRIRQVHFYDSQAIEFLPPFQKEQDG